MEHRFDELAKALAEGVSRREALRRIGGGVVALLLASFGVGKAWGQSGSVDCGTFCKSTVGFDPKSPESKERFAACKTSCEDCQAGGNTVCGVSTTGGGAVTCCSSTATCGDGGCLCIPEESLGCLRNEDCCCYPSCLCIDVGMPVGHCTFP
jgi:hypothetical protein